MPVNAVSAAAASAVAPIVRRSTPAVQELFRHGTLYQPSPPSVVAGHLRSHPSAPKSAAASRFSGYYKPDGVSVPASGIVTKPSGRQPLTDMHSTDNMEEEIARRNRRLTILFTWLGAKEKYANKYIDLWTRRGNAVLHVTCSIKDMLMPKTGAEVTAARVKEHICSLGERSRVVVHGLSVGGYITQHVLKDNDVGVTSKLSHQIYDSFTNVEGLPQGVENAVPPRFSQIAKKIGQLYQRYADMSSFNESRNFILQGEANTPVFFMHSLADRVAQYEVTQPLIAALQAKTSVDVFLVPAEEQIPHVALLRCMGPPAYMELIETFLHHHPDPVY